MPSEKTSKEMRDFRKKMRALIADYMWSEGCSCCQDVDAHNKAEAALAKALNVRKYENGFGYDFGRYRSKENADDE